jgi:hypothetical protein
MPSRDEDNSDQKDRSFNPLQKAKEETNRQKKKKA